MKKFALILCGLFLGLVVLYPVPTSTQAQDITSVDLYRTEDQRFAIFLPPGWFAADTDNGLVLSIEEADLDLNATVSPEGFRLILSLLPEDVLEAIDEEAELLDYLTTTVEMLDLKADSVAVYDPLEIAIPMQPEPVQTVVQVMTYDEQDAAYLIYEIAPNTYAFIVAHTGYEQIGAWQNAIIQLLVSTRYSPPMTEVFESTDEAGFAFTLNYPEMWFIESGLFPSISNDEDALKLVSDAEFVLASGQLYYSVSNMTNLASAFEGQSLSQIAESVGLGAVVAFGDGELELGQGLIFVVDGREIGVIDIIGEEIGGNVLVIQGDEGLFYITYFAPADESYMGFLPAINMLMSALNTAEE